jgi:non-specific protein-tyrosine kinase
VPTLAALPLSTTTIPGPELLALTAPLSPIVEAYRGIRTNLLFADIDTPLHTLLVTSSLAGEGKTRIAANLAIVVAQAGRRVILVDADFRRPRLPEIFRRVDTRGVTNLLLEGGNADGFLWPTQVPGLRLLCTGPLPSNPSEILGSRRMIELIAHLRERSDLVIFDSPPLHAVTDPAVLASRLEGTILVVHAGRTSRTLVKQAGESLHKVGARLLGVVLNKVKDAHQIPYSEYYESSTSPERAAHAMPADEPRANAALTSASAETERVELVR